MTTILASRLESGDLDGSLSRIYVTDEAVAGARAKFGSLLAEFTSNFPGLTPSLYTAAGRTEMGGNHTDHQHGRVLAASVDMETIAVAASNGTRVLRVVSTQYPEDAVDLDDLEPKPEEEGKSIALVRGIARNLSDRGYSLDGATILTLSGVPGGSGLSSSAAFEVLIGNVLGHLFCNDELSPVEIAKVGQYAENVYFGKPSGLMDQMACSVGGIIGIDFADPNEPAITEVNFDLASSGYVMCIIDSGADHADLTEDYADITREMRAVARYFEKDFLRDVSPEEFWNGLSGMRESVGDRAAARAAHFFGDNARVGEQVAALSEGRFDDFLKYVEESGRSSGLYLQNLRSESSDDQSVVLTSALADQLLAGKGAVRVHGGGFAGTVQAYVPTEEAEGFKSRMESVLGNGSCAVVTVRPVGGAFVAE
ncbi:MAG: galactokinase family protein [Scrofimicrobium sp.]